MRNNTIDNAKIFMIFFVVFGHIIEPVINGNSILKTIYLSIYSWHMPIFVIISGMVTNTKNNQHTTCKTVSSVLVPLVIFTCLYELFEVFTHGGLSNYTIHLQPYWILWFLFSLFIWKLSLQFILKFRYPIIISMIISIAAGNIDQVGYFLGISRTLYFLPFFLIGHKLTPSFFSNQKLRYIPKNLYIGILIANLFLCWLLHNQPHQWLYGSFSYNKLDINSIYGMAIRLSLYFVSVVTSLSILMIIPSKKLSISPLGEKSLYIYVWHGFFIKAFLGLGLISYINKEYPNISVALFLSIAMLLTFALSTNVVSKSTQIFLFSWINKHIQIKI